MSKKQTKMSFSDFQKSTLPPTASGWAPLPTSKQQAPANKSSSSTGGGNNNKKAAAATSANKQGNNKANNKSQPQANSPTVASSSSATATADKKNAAPKAAETQNAPPQQQQQQQKQQNNNNKQQKQQQQQKQSSTPAASTTAPTATTTTTAAAPPTAAAAQQQAPPSVNGTNNPPLKKKETSKNDNKNKNKKSSSDQKKKSSSAGGGDNQQQQDQQSEKVELFYRMPKDVVPIAEYLKQKLVVVPLDGDTEQQQQQQLDQPIINYLSCVLHGQNDVGTRTSEAEVIQLLSNFAHETRVCNSKQTASELALSILNDLYEQNLVKKPEAEGPSSGSKVKELTEAISLGRQFEEQQKQNEMMMEVATGTSVPSASSINFNEQLDWEKRMAKLRAEKQAKRDAKERDAKMVEYEEYLKRRGLSNSRGIVKMHNADQVTGTRDVVLRNISVSVGNSELLTDSDFMLHCGHRYGLIGRNGVGKTTLLRHFVERDLVGIPPYLQILHIEQEVTGDETTAIDSVLKTDVERLSLLAEEKKLLEGNNEDADERLTEIYARMDEIDGHSAESRAAAILSGLQFTPEMQNQKTKDFSGGWRMRIALARALFVEPDILLLDEPTNHLDLAAVLWLENYLTKWKKTLVVVSHARSFLNNVVTDIVHFHEKQLHYYRGDYNTFEKTRLDSLKLQQKTFEAQEKQRKHIQQFIDRFRYKTATAKMVQSRIKMLEKIEFVAAVAEDPTFTFAIPSPEPEAPPYLQACDVTFGFSEHKILFKKLNFNLDMDSRIALVGPNGAGKTTFLNVLMGDLKPLDGYVNLNRKLRIARFNQHHIEQLDLRLTPLEYMQGKFPQSDPQALRGHLGGLGLSGTLATQPIYTLSGGQKSRVSFSELTFMKPHLLLLDEPTNHLDIDSVDALIQALNMYGGGILVISHDEHLIKTVCDEIWVCAGGEINKFDGTFDDYKKSLEFK